MGDSFERAAERELASRRRRYGRIMRTGFRIHLWVYVGVQVMLVAIWALSSGPEADPWFVYPLLGWGIGVVAHYAAVRPRRRQAAGDDAS